MSEGKKITRRGSKASRIGRKNYDYILGVKLSRAKQEFIADWMIRFFCVVFFFMLIFIVQKLWEYRRYVLW